MLRKSMLAVLIFSTLLQGCALERINDVQRSAGNTADEASSLIRQAAENRPVVQFQNSQYVSPVPLPVAKYDAPREVVNCNMPYRAIKPQDIWQFSQDIATVCHIRTRVTPDAAAMLGGRGAESGSPTQRLTSVPSPVLPTAGDMRPLDSFGTGTASGAAAGSPGTSRTFSDVTYTGNLGGLLDIVTARLGISWKYEDGMVTFFYLQTARFDIEPSDAKYALNGSVVSGVSNSSSSNGGTGSSSSGSNSGGVSGESGTSLKSDVSMGNNLYDDLKSTAESMLTPGVGRLDMNKTTGTVVITDVPEVVRRVGEYLTSENKALSRQVSLKVVIYTVNTDTSDAIGIDWNVIYKTLAGKYGINLTGPSGTVADAGSLSFSVLDTATGAARQFAGSSFLFDALSKQSKVADVRTIPLMTTNMASASVVVGRQITYLKSVSQTPYSTGNTTLLSQTREPGSVTTGTNITIFPKVLNGGDRMMLNMFLNISSLIALRQIGTADEPQEAPDVDSRSTPVRVWLKPGQTVVISGLEQNVATSDRQGQLSPDNQITGGQRSGDRTRQSFVITVTPYIR
ncbi:MULTISPECIES: PilN family type IVB pilus formation outer membrane protein [Enterobacterales]|uniref:PilN family type IVB pilus formation outer membrane protein n=1 Tax=Enterobacterales TaxID=91347 RepID=UPI0004157654|nr:MULTISPECIES: PilN family type IVB pilus formation outer membrane protein [Enterobacterales]KTR98536.1 conjugal transfer protein [Pantoea dispersa]MCE2003884.1 PilN family type IVB pilus formation outer membrane protein [Enterobacter asburiae]MCI1029679.1 PilN family type IVB pilus formation outer membrane protein [Pantoea dispersa]QZY97756.1 PilN family type IVB pilus formation outer membrane protein [Pantoea dispersa]